jgi:hypothetical protein
MEKESQLKGRNDEEKQKLLKQGDTVRVLISFCSHISSP